jgi:Tfp pilus assembly PilM family ATPase
MVKLKFNVGALLRPAGLRLPSRSPIGLDVGSRWVKAVQLRRDAGGGGWRLEAAARFPRLEPDTPPNVREARRIEEVLSRQGFHGHEVVLATPIDKLMTDLLDLPARTPATPFEQIMRAEVARIHKCDPSKLEIAHWDLPASARSGKGTQVLSFACQHADADAVLDVFQSAGIGVVALDARPAAIARACGPMLSDGQGINAIVVIEWNSAAIVVVHQGVVVYERRVKESGLRRLQEQLRTQLHLDLPTVEHLMDEVGLADEAGRDAGEVVAAARSIMETHLGVIVQELRASLGYATHQYPQGSVSRLLLVGEGAEIPALEAYFARRTALDVRKASAVELVRSPVHLLSLCTAALTPAVGLAQCDE